MLRFGAVESNTGYRDYLRKNKARSLVLPEAGQLEQNCSSTCNGEAQISILANLS